MFPFCQLGHKMHITLKVESSKSRSAKVLGAWHMWPVPQTSRCIETETGTKEPGSGSGLGSEPKNTPKAPNSERDQSSSGPSCQSFSKPSVVGSCHLLNYKIWQGINLASPCWPSESGTAAAAAAGPAGPGRITIHSVRSESSTAMRTALIWRAPVAPNRSLKSNSSRIPVPIPKAKRKVRLNSHNDLARSRP